MTTTLASIFDYIGRILFSRVQIVNFKKLVSSAGVPMQVESFLGYLAISVLLISIVLTSLFYSFQNPFANVLSFLPSFVAGIVMFAVFFVLAYLSVYLVVTAVLSIQSDARRNALETILPDYLLLVSANIKAGMGIDQAMWYSAKNEFGLLSIEIKNVIKSSFSGEPFENALDTLSERFDSRIFTRTITLIKQSFATGGEMAQVLEETARDVRNTYITKKEVSASLVLYEIFIFFAGVMGTPFLFAVSSKLIQIFEIQRLALPSTTATIGGFESIKISGNIISSGDFYAFSLFTIFVTVLFSSFIISVIRTGNKNEGVKYFPFMLILAYFIYFVVNAVLASFFATVT